MKVSTGGGYIQEREKLHVAWKVIESHGNGVRLGNMEEEVVAKEKYLMRRSAVALAGALRVHRVSEPSDFGVASVKTVKGLFESI